MLFACATAVNAPPDSGANHPHDVQVTRESWISMRERFVKDPAQFQFASSTTSTKQIADEISTLKDEIDETIEGNQSRNSTEDFDTIFGVPHEISSFYVLAFLLAFIIFAVWSLFKCCCRCQAWRTRGRSLRRTPSFGDTVIQRIEDVICMHRPKPHPAALEMSRMMQETA